MTDTKRDEVEELRRDVYRIHEHENMPDDENCIDCEHFAKNLIKLGYRKHPSPALAWSDRDKLEEICSKHLRITVPSEEAKNMTLEFDDYEKMLNEICSHFTLPSVPTLEELELLIYDTHVNWNSDKAIGVKCETLIATTAKAIHALITQQREGSPTQSNGGEDEIERARRSVG